MNDEQFADALVAKFQSDSTMHGFESAGPHGGRLRDVLQEIIDKAREIGAPVPWGKLLSLLPVILQMLASGGMNWTQLISAILAIFFPTPTPTT